MGFLIGLWGSPDDQPLADVADTLTHGGARVLWLDEHDTIAVSGSDHRRPEVESGGRAVNLDDLSGVYFRPYDPGHAQLLVSWLDVAPVTVVNRPSSMLSNTSKPFQSRSIVAAGFATPATLVTTDAEEARAFVAMHQDVIYKSVSGVRSIASVVAADDPRLGGPLACPTQFQRRVPGPDLRVHVVGHHLFGCLIESNAVDYRYARRQGTPISMHEVPVPDDVARSAVALCAHLGLDVGGLDLRRDADGSWVCFEVNPSPAFSFFDRAVHEGAIASAVAALLQGTDGG